MPILDVLYKSFLETLRPKRFLPFFLLYFLFSICFLLFFMPIMSVSPYLFSLNYSPQQLALVGVNIMAIIIIFILTLLLNLWFTGALIFGVWKKKDFELGLAFTKKVYLQLLAVGFILAIISSVLYFIDIFGMVIQFIVSWFLIFSIVSVIVKKDTFEIAIMRSFSIVRKNLTKTLFFFIFTYIIFFVLIFASLILSAAMAAPVISRFSYILSALSTTSSESLSQGDLIQLVGLLMNNYPTFFLISIVISLFLSISNVFVLTAKTYYFIELTKKSLSPFK